MKKTIRSYGIMLLLACIALAWWWVFALAAIVFGVWSRRDFASLMLALIFDVIYGVPPASFHWLAFPLTIFALACIALRVVAERFVHR